MRHRRIGRGAAVAVILAVSVALPAEAQLIQRCEVYLTLETQLRRVTGTVMTECGGECVLFWCEDAPFGNWGVESDYTRRSNTRQFPGWKPDGSRSEWNSCTLQYYDGPYVNDGRGRQKSDSRARVGGNVFGQGPANDTCREYVAEVVEGHADMTLYEMDRWTRDDRVTDLGYGTFDIPVTCSNDWTCDGVSEWQSQTSVDSTGVSAEARVKLRARRIFTTR